MNSREYYGERVFPCKVVTDVKLPTIGFDCNQRKISDIRNTCDIYHVIYNQEKPYYGLEIGGGIGGSTVLLNYLLNIILVLAQL